MAECWIFGSGPIYDYSFYNIPEGAFIIAADGGLKHLSALELRPDIILGDFDSYDGELPGDCEIMTVPSRKDDTDMMLAVKTALARGYKEITLCGSLGGRLDHTIANIQTLEYISERGGKGRLLSEDNTVTFQKAGRERYPAAEGFYFSVFSFTDETVVTTRGTKYDLTDYRLTRSFPLGVSNEITAAYAEAEVKNGILLVVFSKK